MANYSPTYVGVWNDARLEGLPFEGKGFFVYLCSNERIRPSGIYRATDEQFAADTGLPLKRVQGYLRELVSRRRIVRDGAWIFIRGYLKRQPKQEFLLKSVEIDVTACTSASILTSFGEKYPIFNQWSADRLATFARPTNDSTASDAEHLQSRADAEHVDGQPTVTPSPTKVCIEILSFLNRKAGRTYRASETNLGLIRGRLADGIQDWQLKAIVSRKVKEWAGDPKMAEYLRPATLFNKTKCEQYLGELPPPPVEEAHD